MSLLLLSTTNALPSTNNAFDASEQVYQDFLFEGTGTAPNSVDLDVSFKQSGSLAIIKESQTGSNYATDNTNHIYTVRENTTTYGAVVCKINTITNEVVWKKSLGTSRSQNSFIGADNSGQLFVLYGKDGTSSSIDYYVVKIDSNTGAFINTKRVRLNRDVGNSGRSNFIRGMKVKNGFLYFMVDHKDAGGVVEVLSIAKLETNNLAVQWIKELTYSSTRRHFNDQTRNNLDITNDDKVVILVPSYLNGESVNSLDLITLDSSGNLSLTDSVKINQNDGSYTLTGNLFLDGINKYITLVKNTGVKSISLLKLGVTNNILIDNKTTLNNNYTLESGRIFGLDSNGNILLPLYTKNSVNKQVWSGFITISNVSNNIGLPINSSFLYSKNLNLNLNLGGICKNNKVYFNTDCPGVAVNGITTNGEYQVAIPEFGSPDAVFNDDDQTRRIVKYNQIVAENNSSLTFGANNTVLAAVDFAVISTATFSAIDETTTITNVPVSYTYFNNINKASSDKNGFILLKNEMPAGAGNWRLLVSSNTNGVSHPINVAGGFTNDSFVTEFRNGTLNMVGNPADNTNKSGDKILGMAFKESAKFLKMFNWVGDGNEPATETTELDAPVGFVMVRGNGGVDPDNKTTIWHKSMTGVSSPTANGSPGSALTAWPYGTQLDLTGNDVMTLTDYIHVSDTSIKFKKFKTLGVEYSAMVFANDTGPNGIVRCGVFTSNGLEQEINIGWEPDTVWLFAHNRAVNGDTKIVITKKNDLGAIRTSNSGGATKINLGSTAPTSIAVLNFGVSTRGIIEKNPNGSVWYYVAFRKRPKLNYSSSDVFKIAVNSSFATNDLGYSDMAMMINKRTGTGVANNYIIDRHNGIAQKNAGSGTNPINIGYNKTNRGAQQTDGNISPGSTTSPTGYLDSVGRMFASMGGAYQTVTGSVVYGFKRQKGFFSYLKHKTDMNPKHGLGVEPEFVISVPLNKPSKTVSVYHKNMTSNKEMDLSGSQGITNRVVFSGNPDVELLHIAGFNTYSGSSVVITNGGSGYQSVPTVTFNTVDGGSGFAATAILGNPVYQYTQPGNPPAWGQLSVVVTYASESPGYPIGLLVHSGPVTNVGDTFFEYRQSENAVFGPTSDQYAIYAITSIVLDTVLPVDIYTYSVTSLNVSNYGSGYSGNSSALTFSGGGGGSGAVAGVTGFVLDNNSSFVGGINVTNGGSGYQSAPTVTITGGGGSGATATATISAYYPGQEYIAPSGYHAATPGQPYIAPGPIGWSVVSSSWEWGGPDTELNLPTPEEIGATWSGCISSSYSPPGPGDGSTPYYNIYAEYISTGNPGQPYIAPTDEYYDDPGQDETQPSGGVITSITVTSNGLGYTSLPTVNITGGGGSGATAVVTGLGSNGAILPTEYMSYCWATVPGISKIGSYNGNGNTQAIDCSFTNGARFVLIKNELSGNWYIFDSVRGIVAAGDSTMFINSDNNSIEVSVDVIDPHAAGFIVNHDASAPINTNGQKYIYMAIA